MIKKNKLIQYKIMSQSFKFVTAEEAASYINNGDVVGFSGFTAAGSPKVVPTALAKRAEEFHRQGKEFKIGMFTGASTTRQSSELPDSLPVKQGHAQCAQQRRNRLL